MMGRDYKIKNSLRSSPAALLPTRNQAGPGLDRMPLSRGREALMALARLLARRAARELAPQE
jgi:hypothetical protein